VLRAVSSAGLGERFGGDRSGASGGGGGKAMWDVCAAGCRDAASCKNETVRVRERDDLHPDAPVCAEGKEEVWNAYELGGLLRSMEGTSDSATGAEQREGV
jgi:hypothetical protein